MRDRERERERKTETCIRRWGGLLQGYHEYEHWLHHAIISKLVHCAPKAERTILEPTSTAVLSLPPGSDPPHMRAVQPKDHLTITLVSMTQDQGGCG